MSFIPSGPKGQRFLGQELGGNPPIEGAALPLCYVFFSLVELIAELKWVRLLSAHGGSKPKVPNRHLAVETQARPKDSVVNHTMTRWPGLRSICGSESHLMAFTVSYLAPDGFLFSFQVRAVSP